MSRHAGLAILVADGARARLMLRHDGGDYDTLEAFEAEKVPGRGERDTRPRVFASGAGERRSALEPDAQAVADERRRRFASRLAEALNLGVESGRFESFAIVAPARMLPRIREGLAPRVRGRLRKAVAGDITKLPTPDLHRRLDSLALTPYGA